MPSSAPLMASPRLSLPSAEPSSSSSSPCHNFVMSWPRRSRTLSDLSMVGVCEGCADETGLSRIDSVGTFVLMLVEAIGAAVAWKVWSYWIRGFMLEAMGRDARSSS